MTTVQQSEPGVVRQGNPIRDATHRSLKFSMYAVWWIRWSLMNAIGALPRVGGAAGNRV